MIMCFFCNSKTYLFYRTWKEGKFIIFDDSFEHEVWHYNERNESRLILQFQFRHPDWMPDEPAPVIKFNVFGKHSQPRFIFCVEVNAVEKD